MIALATIPVARAQDADPAWRSETVEVGVPLNGCAVGDVDPTRPGNEVVAVAEDGSIIVAWREASGWKHATLAKTDGELMQVAVGDLLPDVPGDEVAAGGVDRGREGDEAPGVLFVARRDGQGWKAEAVHGDEVLVHAVAISAGAVWFGGAGPELHVLFRTGRLEGGVPRDDGWSRRDGANRTAQARSAVAARGGMVFTYRDGTVTLVTTKREDDLASRELDRRPVGRARIDAHGDDLLVADDDGVLSLLPAQGARVEVFRAKDKLRGAVLRDLDPDSPGIEAATAGYDGQVVLLRRAGAAWTPRVVARTDSRFHHLAAGELPGVGLSLVGASLGGRLVVASRVGR